MHNLLDSPESENNVVMVDLKRNDHKSYKYQAVFSVENKKRGKHCILIPRLIRIIQIYFQVTD